MVKLCGCGYHLGYQPHPGLRTIAVPIAENDSLRRQLEFPLTESVVREIQRRTPLIIREPSAADATLKLTIAQVTEHVLVQGENAEVLESALEVHLHVRVVDRDGTTMISSSLQESAEFVFQGGAPTLTSSAASTNGPAAVEAFSRLAERVVMLLEAPLGTPSSEEAPRSQPR